MPQILPIDSLNTTPSKGVVLSPAISQIVKGTHERTLREINKFLSYEMNPFSMFGEYIRSILDEPNPEIFSRKIKFKKLVHELEEKGIADDYHAQEKGKKAEIIQLNQKTITNIPFENAA